MKWERIRIAVMLAPTLLVISILFFGSLLYGFLQSLGYNPNIGATDINFDAYLRVMFSEEFSGRFWSGLTLSLWVAFCSTFVSAAIAIFVALLLRRTFFGKKLAVFFFQLNLPIPHLVIAVGMIMLFSQSGLVSRMLGELGLVTSPRDFPALTKDAYGIGIILAYIWKEVAFFGIIVLAILQSLGEDYEAVAQSLGANRREILREVILPAALPQILTGLQIAMPICLIVVLITEMIMGGQGLGDSMLRSARYVDSPGVFAGIVEIGLVGFCVIKAMEYARRRLLVWHPETRTGTTI